MKRIFAISLIVTATLFSCKQQNKYNVHNTNKEDTSDATPNNELAIETKVNEFSWNDVPESNVDVGAYPYIIPPKGMKIDKSNSDTQSYDFHKLEMFNGNAIFSLEGKVEKMSVAMDSYDKPWNQYLFDKSVDDYLKSIGAKQISDKKIPEELIKKWGDTPNEQYEHMHKFYVGDVVNDIVKMFVLKTPHRKIGFQVYSNSATGNIGVVEVENFKQTIEKITAEDMLKAINEKGFATLHINFDTGKSRIKADSYNVVSEIAKMMTSNPDLKISIEGHTDNVGDANSNLKLSKNRARSVLIALTDEGVDESRLTSEGFGQTKPIGDNTTEEGKSKNRRVELRKI